MRERKMMPGVEPVEALAAEAGERAMFDHWSIPVSGLAAATATLFEEADQGQRNHDHGAEQRIGQGPIEQVGEPAEHRADRVPRIVENAARADADRLQK